MKRGAEKQLTKDESDEDAGDEPGTGFKVADESTLATRKIRGLPRRRAVGGATPSPASGSSTPEPATESAPKFAGFGGFGGFGATSSATSPFTFSAAKPAPTPATPATTNATPAAAPVSVFGSSAPTSTPAPAPTVSSTASNAAKTFASFLSTPAEPKPQNGIPTTNGTVKDDEKFKAEKKYYLALRGLNVAFLDAIKKAVDADPFVDLADAYGRYKTLREGVKADYEKDAKATVSSTSETKPSATTNGAPTSSSSFSFSSASGSSATSSKPPPTLPTPPSSFSFGTPAASTSATSSGSGGFKPDPTKSADSGSSGTKSPFSFPAPSGGFSFPGNSSSKPAESTSTSSSPFGNSATPSVFGSNLFGSKPEAKDATKADDNPFKIGAPAPSGTGNQTAAAKPLFNVSPPARSGGSGGFSFGGSSSGFGGSIGFGFGGAGKSDDTKPAASSSSTPSGSFSWPATTPKSTLSLAEVSEAAAAEDAAPMKMSGPSIHDAEGEGEEDEDTTYEVRSKVFRMTKKDDGSQSWTDYGVGMLRVKKHKETASRRLLLRNSSTGKIIINFNVYNGMNPSVAKNVVSFVGHDNGNSVLYKLRVKTNEAADDLKAALDREIEFVKAKSSD